MNRISIKQKVGLHEMIFSFVVLCDSEILLFYYGYGGKACHRSRSRKIYSDKKGRYFLFQRKKVRI